MFVQRRQESLNRCINLIWLLRHREMPGAGKLQVPSSRYLLLNLFLVFRRLGRVVQSPDQEHRCLELINPFTDVESVNGQKISVLRERPHLTVAGHQTLPKIRSNVDKCSLLMTKPSFIRIWVSRGHEPHLVGSWRPIFGTNRYGHQD